MPEATTISIDDVTLADLRDRLARTRWPDEVAGAGWEYGTNLDYLRKLVAYWKDEFDWGEQEARLNEFDQYRGDTDGVGIHFVHERGEGENPTPLLLLHGWPSTFVQMLDIVPMLTTPSEFGGNPDESFDVVVPSLPGYGFSDRPTERGMSVPRIADLFHTLMTDELGYDRYAGRGSDIGAGVLLQLGLKYPESIIGLHLSGTNPRVEAEMIPDDPTEAETEFIENAERWGWEEAAYAMEQSTKPQTLAYGLNDSPAGLAAWILEKFRTWSDNDGDVEEAFARDDLLTNLTIYWATETINSSMRLYYESVRDAGEWGRPDVPTALLMAPADMFPTPREWAERFYRIDRWTETERGGHFLEWEEPELTAEDIRAFFGSL
ncbi:epoxide hydrolase [Haladaptatus sp. R4]|uniref:epoxide hydrolase family protein n=1 Tax=Haladaptatus sp. R4 TaxID=1679489 RepID=UPI0007B4B9F9|nr:epoxide hydrolase family protein [Haladaptatus sp. R4]KZN23651.1 epoxide hydrolase [Haladaptatus sp. R4]